MNEAKLKSLLHDYFNDTINQEDRIALLVYLKNADLSKIEGFVSEDLLNLEKGSDLFPARKQAVWKKIISDSRYTAASPDIPHNQSQNIKLYNRTWFKAAAVLLVVFAIGLIVFQKHPAEMVANKHNLHPGKNTVILPGSTKAILTTDDGKELVLNQTSNGVVVKNRNTQVLKTRNGQIVYNSSKSKPSIIQQVRYNTLTTPKGGEYQVILADGTKIWLNAASSITYPTTFDGKDRRVKLSGEAYFEVAKNVHQPFYVNTGNGEIRVLGTHFNISAYPDDETTSTTLLEGSILITKHQSSYLLKPGQQANIGYQSDDIEVTEAKTDEVMAWKNGYFIFNDESIAGIMKKVARWYDVDVQLLGSVDAQKFGGTFHRSKTIAELLHYLEKIGNIHFSITGRRITVTG
ncbi:FecR family protein [Mucilaginibacter sp.]|uniref:FecR family protein n=1 Tax=Mucilaginibacter sp. TaxID=1882438 RepID=UPI003B00F938